MSRGVALFVVQVGLAGVLGPFLHVLLEEGVLLHEASPTYLVLGVGRRGLVVPVLQELPKRKAS